MMLTFPERVLYQSLVKLHGKISFAQKDTMIPRDICFKIIHRLQEKNYLGTISMKGSSVEILPISTEQWNEIKRPNPFVLHQLLDKDFLESACIDFYCLNEDQQKEYENLVAQLKQFIFKIKLHNSFKNPNLYDKKILILGDLSWKKILEKTWNMLTVGNP